MSASEREKRDTCRVIEQARAGSPVSPEKISDALRASGDIPQVSAAEWRVHNALRRRDAGCIQPEETMQWEP